MQALIRAYLFLFFVKNGMILKDFNGE